MVEINWISESLDTAFSLLGKYGRWMNAKGKKVCFIIWNICVLYWIVRNMYIGLYSQAIFCLVSVFINTFGYFKWSEKERLLVVEKGV